MAAAVVGTFVPNYDVYGHQHHRVPFKDKGVFGIQKPLWTHDAKFKSRSELQQHRRAEQVPHISYDLDGDGVVGDTDHFIARHFDKTAKGSLTKKERAQCEEALGNDFRNRFLMGLEKQGKQIPCSIQQRRGKIITPDTAFELGETYPPHYNAHVKPKHRTQTEMKEDRRLERRESAKAIKKNWDAQNPVKVEERVIQMEGYVQNPRVSHVRQIAQADSEEQRTKCGLYPTATYVNPERAHMQPGLQYVEEPEFPTRGAMLAHRKEMLTRDLDANRVEGEERTIPMSVRRSEREAHCHEFRQCPEGAMTQSLMEKQRKCERIEYNRTHFGEHMKQLPRYSDQPHPFWTLERCSSAPPCPSKAQRAHASAPRTTAPEHEYDPQTEAEPCPAPGMVQERPSTVGHDGEFGHKTVKRWTTAKIDSGQMKDAPRLFDSLPAAKTLANDHRPAELYSSFDFVRNHHMRNIVRNGRQEVPLTSQLRPHDEKGPSLVRSQSAAPGGRTASKMTSSTDTFRTRRIKSACPSRGGYKQQGAPNASMKAMAPKPPVRMADTLRRQASAPTIRAGGIRTGFESTTNLNRPQRGG